MSGGKGGGGDRGAEGGSDGGEENSQPQPQPPLLLTPLTLEDVVRAAQPHELSLDSFAVRSLLLCAKPLRGAVAVSGLSPAPGKFVARAAVSLSSGEEMTLTLSLVEEERAVAHYKSVRTERHWALVSARCVGFLFIYFFPPPGGGGQEAGGKKKEKKKPGKISLFFFETHSPPKKIRGEPCSSAEEGKSKNDAKSVRDARHGPEVVLDAFLSALSRGDGATVFGLTGLRAGAGARALADAVGGSLFAASIDQGGEEEEEEEEEGGGGDGGGGGGGGGGESVPPWLRGSDNGGGDDGGDSPSSSPSSSRRRFPRELEPLVALFLSGSRYDLLSVKMLSARQAWGMAGVRPLGDDGSGFVLGGSGAAPPSAPPPSSSSSPSPSPSVEQGDGGGEPSPSQQPRQKQWQDNLPQQSERAAFIFRLELCAADGSWEVRDVARVGGGGLSGGGAFSLGG